MSNQQKPQQPPQRNASQRIDDLERGLMSLYHTADNMARDLGIIKDAIKLLGNKLDSVVKVSVAGKPLNDENIAAQMVANNIEELKGKVDDMVKQGLLVPIEVVGPQSFVVGRELAEDGSVPNPRMQFVVSGLNEVAKAKLPGAKVGEVVNVEDGKWKFEVQEIYAIVPPKAPEIIPAAAPVAEAAPEVAPEASAPAAEAPAATGEGQDQSSAPEADKA